MKINTITFAFILITCFSCGQNDEVIKTEDIRTVKYDSVTVSGGTKILSYSGTTQSASETRLSFRIGGLVMELWTDVGQKVMKNQILAVLDQTDNQLNYDKAVSNERSAKIQLETSKSNLERVKQLYLANSASLSDYENEKNNYAGALANYESAKKSKNLQGAQFSYSKIIAPTDGVISDVSIEPNEFVQAGSTVFIFNAENSEIEAKIGVPEKQISKINEGQSVLVTLGDQELTGIVTGVSFSNSGSSTYPVIITLEKNETLRPGMACKATFEFENGNNESTLIVPIKAVGNASGGSFVFVLNKNDATGNYTTEKRVLELGPITDDGFTVITGLKEGELVATAGLSTITDGMKVRLLNGK